MDAGHLTREQLDALYAAVSRHLRFCGRLRARMDRLGWEPADPFRSAVERAYDAVHALSVKTHYARMPKQTGGHAGPPPSPAPPSPSASPPPAPPGTPG